MKIEWKDGHEITVTVDNGTAVIAANKEGLQSLAIQFMALSEEPDGTHIHYDEYNSLTEGSAELIVSRGERKDDD